MGFRLFLLLFILAVNAFFAAGEVSLVSVRRSRLRAHAEQGDAGAALALDLLANPQRLLSVSQLGVTLASLGLGWAGEETVYQLLVDALHPIMSPATTQYLHAASLVAAFLLISFLHIILGEVLPKNLALSRADRLAVLVAPPMLIFSRISAPFVWIVEQTTKLLSNKLGLSSHGSGGHSAEELKFIVTTSRTEGHLETFEEDAIQKILELHNIYAREIMVPRNNMVAVPVEATLDQVLRVISEHKYSRVPVYEGSPEKLVGLVHYKDLLRLWQERKSAHERKRPDRPFKLRRYLRAALLVPETKPLPALIDELRATHAHMAFVVDEFGTISGLVTIEDLFEQVFGEIEDEFDDRKPPQPPAEAPVVEVEGTIPIRDLVTQYQIELPGDAGFETLAGFLLFKLGYIPKPGDEIEYGNRKFTILEMERNRIAKVRVERTGEAAA
ncbi:MAG TPA: hemolysin family protein [Bryobacteraceae bacterium]|jgi:CBS domain containing-hemolysin-like protein